MKLHGSLASALLVAAVFCIVGCDQGPQRYDVSGTITHDGEPIPRGSLEFLPDTSKGNSGPAGHAQIIDGKFNTAETGQGTIGGPHRVTVTAFDGNAQPELDLPNGDPLFYDYSEEIDLPLEDTTIEIKVPKQKSPVSTHGGEGETGDAA